MSTSLRRFGSPVSFCLSSEWWLRMTVALSNTSAREVNAFSPFLNPRTASTSTATLSSMSVNEDNLEGSRAVKLTTIEEARDAVASSKHSFNCQCSPSYRWRFHSRSKRY
ncbi:hypothetical protein T08_3947 [Trichinella sp. T8]|nr:hypothetical protein T08_3947 [Trichinella sp. T8]